MKKIAAMVLALVCAACTLFEAKASGPCEGKTVVFLGDSYVKNHRHPAAEARHARAAEELGMKYVNFGRNGSSVAFDRTKEGFGPAMTERYKEMPDSADMVIVIAGHNDAGMVGTPERWADFCKGLDTLLDGLRAKYPRAALGFVTPWAVDRPGFSEVTEQIRKACVARGVSVLDASVCGLIDPNDAGFRARYFQGPADTAHLNAEGHALFLPLGRGFMEALALKINAAD
ncbi:MAG: SGNH/GDSL hydrolase family protein [Muribaculaceae bacterium]|nr:SGNH/GDSL hydrolase family protein [Muribaculaceae bacterium]